MITTTTTFLAVPMIWTCFPFPTWMIAAAKKFQTEFVIHICMYNNHTYTCITKMVNQIIIRIIYERGREAKSQSFLNNDLCVCVVVVVAHVDYMKHLNWIGFRSCLWMPCSCPSFLPTYLPAVVGIENKMAPKKKKTQYRQKKKNILPQAERQEEEERKKRNRPLKSERCEMLFLNLDRFVSPSGEERRTPQDHHQRLILMHAGDTKKWETAGDMLSNAFSWDRREAWASIKTFPILLFF